VRSFLRFAIFSFFLRYLSRRCCVPSEFVVRFRFFPRYLMRRWARRSQIPFLLCRRKNAGFLRVNACCRMMLIFPGAPFLLVTLGGRGAGPFGSESFFLFAFFFLFFFRKTRCRFLWQWTRCEWVWRSCSWQSFAVKSTTIWVCTFFSNFPEFFFFA